MNTNEIIRQVEEEVKKELKGIINEDALGYIHCFEERKKEKLKEKVKVLDEDDLLRIDFIPEKNGGEGNAIDSLEK